jgi:capsid assembly protease
MKNLEELQGKYPKIYQAVFDKGHAEGLNAAEGKANDKALKDGIAQGRTEGAQAERDRIKAVEDQLIPGHEALIETLKFDGSTTGEQAAVKVLQSEKTMRADLAQKLKDDAPDPVPHAPAPEGDDPKTPQAIWDHDENLRAEFQNDFDRYAAFLKAEAAGQIRIVSRQ